MLWMPTEATERRIAMTAMTAMISTRVKPRCRREGLWGGGEVDTVTLVLGFSS
jgi:hypothetical protein